MSTAAVTKPVWFCDIDGVINALNHRRYLNVDWVKSEVVHAGTGLGIDGTYPLAWDPKVIDFINRMSEKVEFVWLTSWAHVADMSLPPLTGLHGGWANGFEYVNLIPLRHDVTSVWHKKFETVQRTVFDRRGQFFGRPFIWTDDHMSYEVPAKIENFDYVDRSLLVKPTASRGLDEWDLERIEGFVNTFPR